MKWQMVVVASSAGGGGGTIAGAGSKKKKTTKKSQSSLVCRGLGIGTAPLYLWGLMGHAAVQSHPHR